MAEVDAALKGEFERLFGTDDRADVAPTQADRHVDVQPGASAAPGPCRDGARLGHGLHRRHHRDDRAARDPDGLLARASSELQWVVNAYTLMLGALILVGGALGDRVGRRRDLRHRHRDLRRRLARSARSPPNVDILIAARAAAGHRRRAARAAEPCHHRGDVSARGARPRDRLLGRRLRHHHRARAAARRLPDRHVELAGGLPDQPAALGGRAVADVRLCAGEPRRRRVGTDRLDRPASPSLRSARSPTA